MKDNRFGKNLKILRETEGKLQREIAQALGVQRTTVNKWENGKIEPDLDTLVAIAKLFDVSFDYLLEEN